MLKNITLSFLFSLILVSGVHSQEIVIYSKNSETLAKAIQTHVDSLNDEFMQKLLVLKTIEAKVSSSTKYDGKSFDVDSTFDAKLKELSANKIKEFLEKAEKLDKKIAKDTLPTLQTEISTSFTEELDKLKSQTLKPLDDAKIELNSEIKYNTALNEKVKVAAIPNIVKEVDQINQIIKSTFPDAQISFVGEPITDIRKLAEERTTTQSEKAFPFPEKSKVVADAEKKYPLYKVGDNVTLIHSPNPARPIKASGALKSINDKAIKIGFDNINIDDINDPIIRDGMRPAVTEKNRNTYVEEVFQDLRKKRAKFYNDNLQKNVDKIILENEANGFYLLSNKWQTITQFTTAVITKKVDDWKKINLTKIESAILKSAQIANTIDRSKDTYNTAPTEVALKFTSTLEEELKQVLAKVAVANSSNNLSDEEYLKFIEEQDKKNAALEAEKAKKAAEERQRKADIAKKQALLAEQQAQKEEESSMGNIIFLSCIVLAIGALALAFFNPKIRAKILRGPKKRNMQDVLVNFNPSNGLQPNANLPMPGAAANADPSKSNQTDKQAGATDDNSSNKTKIEFDNGISIVRGENADNVQQATPRKKISLSLGGSTPSLSEAEQNDGSEQDENSSTQASGLTPPGAGGLTPPGGLKPPGAGGLTPPGGLKPPGAGGLTPPGGLKPPGAAALANEAPQGEDKSNLILNPNLDGSGMKLRLKK